MINIVHMFYFGMILSHCNVLFSVMLNFFFSVLPLLWVILVAAVYTFPSLTVPHALSPMSLL